MTNDDEHCHEKQQSTFTNSTTTQIKKSTWHSIEAIEMRVATSNNSTIGAKSLLW
jgi:hypothetical protein